MGGGEGVLDEDTVQLIGKKGQFVKTRLLPPELFSHLSGSTLFWIPFDSNSDLVLLML